MRVALIGAGRIGRLHARILTSLPGVDGLIVADAVPAAAQSVADEVGGVFAASAEEAMAGADAVAIAAATDAHAGLLRLAIGLRKPTLHREAARLRPRPDPRAGRPRRVERGARPARVPAPVRRRLCRGAADGGGRRDGRDLHHPPHRPRRRAAARGLHPDLRRAVPRLVDPRFRRAPVHHRAGGRGRLRGRRRAGLRDVREVRRHRHGSGDPAADRRHDRDAHADARQPARLRHPDGDRRLARRGLDRAGQPHPDPPAGRRRDRARAGLGRLPDPVRARLSGRADDLPRGGPGRGPEPVPPARRLRGDADRDRRDHVAPARPDRSGSTRSIDGADRAGAHRRRADGQQPCPAHRRGRARAADRGDR